MSFVRTVFTISWALALPYLQFRVNTLKWPFARFSTAAELDEMVKFSDSLFSASLRAMSSPVLGVFRSFM